MSCNGKDHADAAREQALAEVEQTLAFRWRGAWKDWRHLVNKGAPVDTISIAWGRQAEALDAAEVVAGMRGEGGVESLQRWLWDDIQAGGV